MELNREQVVKALECCIYEKPCRLCPLNDYSHDAEGCKRELMKHALALIRELTEEIERLSAELSDALNKQVELLKEKVKLELFDLVAARQEADLYKELYLNCQADTVRKVLQRIKEDAVAGLLVSNPPTLLLSNPPRFMLQIPEYYLDRIAKELLEETK